MLLDGRPILSNEDIYAGVRELQHERADASEADWVERLHVALAGSTSGEIFGDLRCELRGADVAAKLGLEPQIEELLDALNGALGYAAFYQRVVNAARGGLGRLRGR